MARIRTIKPDFFRSRSLARCSIPARLTFEGLWCEADDHGRGIADPRLIKGSIWPLDDEIDSVAIDAHLLELEKTGHIRIYEHGVDKYYEIHSWEKHQAAAYRRGEAVHPEPPSDQGEQPTHDESCEKVQDARPVVLEGKGREGKGSTQRVRACKLPADFSVTDAMLEWASSKSIRSNIQRETEKFTNHWQGNGQTKVDWVATWRKWMLQADDYLKERGGTPDPVVHEARHLEVDYS